MELPTVIGEFLVKSKSFMQFIKKLFSKKKREFICLLTDLNRRLLAYHASTLPAELRRQEPFVRISNTILETLVLAQARTAQASLTASFLCSSNS